MRAVPTPCSWANQAGCTGTAVGAWRSPAPSAKNAAPRALCLGHGELLEHHHGWERVDAPLPSPEDEAPVAVARCGDCGHPWAEHGEPFGCFHGIDRTTDDPCPCVWTRPDPRVPVAVAPAAAIDGTDARLRAAVADVVRAIRDYGIAPTYHHQIHERHRLQWPTLHTALDKLLATYDTLPPDDR